MVTVGTVLAETPILENRLNEEERKRRNKKTRVLLLEKKERVLLALKHYNLIGEYLLNEYGQALTQGNIDKADAFLKAHQDNRQVIESYKESYDKTIARLDDLS